MKVGELDSHKGTRELASLLHTEISGQIGALLMEADVEQDGARLLLPSTVRAHQKQIHTNYDDLPYHIQDQFLNIANRVITNLRVKGE